MVGNAFPTDHEWLRAALDSMAEGVLILDEAGTVVFFSAGAEAITGIAASDMMGRPGAEGLVDEVNRPSDKDLEAHRWMRNHSNGRAA